MFRTEIIEGVRSLSQNKVYYAKVRLALLLCALIVTAIDLLLVVLGHVVVEIFEVTSFFVNIVVCLFGLAILILNIINLARSFQFWSVAKGSRSMKSLRFRSYLLPLSAVGFGYITASIVGATMDSTSSPWRYFSTPSPRSSLSSPRFSWMRCSVPRSLPRLRGVALDNAFHVSPILHISRWLLAWLPCRWPFAHRHLYWLPHWDWALQRSWPLDCLHQISHDERRRSHRSFAQGDEAPTSEGVVIRALLLTRPDELPSRHLRRS